MTATRQLHDLGQSLWLDNITRDLLRSGGLQRVITEFDVTGLTSNPSIFQKAIDQGDAYDEQLRAGAARGLRGEALFLESALQDLQDAADLFRPVFERTAGVDGWVSLEVSPLLAHDSRATLAMAKDLHARAGRPNLFIKIPGTREGVLAIEEAIFAGVPINVTLLFSREQYLDAAEAWLRGVERRIEAGLNPDVASVASLFISRWDVAVKDEVPEGLRNQLGIAVGQQAYAAYRNLLESPRWQRVLNAGARPQRLLFASTGTKDKSASDVLYVQAFAAPLTVNTLPDETLKAFADHGEVGAPLARDGGNSADVLERFAQAGVDIHALASRLQQEGEDSFNKAWRALLDKIASKTAR